MELQNIIVKVFLHVKYKNEFKDKSIILYKTMFVQYAKFIMTVLLCIIFLPFSISDLYIGLFSTNECLLKEYEMSMKDYLLLSGYGELILLITTFIIISCQINDGKSMYLYYIIYSGIYTIYTIWNMIGMYILSEYILNYCNTMYEYILISLIIKMMMTMIIVMMLI